MFISLVSSYKVYPFRPYLASLVDLNYPTTKNLYTMSSCSNDFGSSVEEGINEFIVFIEKLQDEDVKYELHHIVLPIFVHSFMSYSKMAISYQVKSTLKLTIELKLIRFLSCLAAKKLFYRFQKSISSSASLNERYLLDSISQTILTQNLDHLLQDFRCSNYILNLTNKSLNHLKAFIKVSLKFKLKKKIKINYFQLFSGT